MPSSLPTETLCTIFEYLPPGALSQLTLVSYRFRAIAERVLYTNIAILEPIPHSNPVPSRTCRCCETILQNPRLTALVKRLSVRWQTDPGPHDQYMPYVAPALWRLNRMLRVLTQLEILDISIGLVGAPITAQTILDGCRFPALRLFALCGVGRGGLRHPAHHTCSTPSIDRFLAATPSIRHLRLSDHFEPLALLASDLPALSAFRGTAIAAASLIPGRPICCLTLTGPENVTDEELVHIARGSVRIRWLDLSNISATPILLRDVSRRLPEVQLLKFKLALRHTLHHSFTGISILAGLTPVLGAFPRLSTLDLSSTPVSNMGLGSSLEEFQLCTTWARSCPSLRNVIFPSKTEWTRSPEHTWVSSTTPYYTRH
ncbi:hypothetical protein POSPLADRAFT_1054515 [Postia placenta MAD-698-R-SB12]|uniref:F-box domain-containing protein n=1 Tax=Postia placenta MAD-698-R-SB12 TaxID=670580 RepID=A0A1X6N644_9APHY|nr:hypothetical protein POSPLADRAFT_1054515 [Postia placenta MAD-698-R-SB12]OSX63883.1 hypothetical protein POSPLADRAFT_1054515 [Postia placenta MAD-698-R-SB12]